MELIALKAVITKDIMCKTGRDWKPKVYGEFPNRNKIDQLIEVYSECMLLFFVGLSEIID